MTTQPPGWFDDPTHRCDHRWWDGSTWTMTVTLDGGQFLDPLEPTLPEGHRIGPPRAPVSAEDCAEAFADVGATDGVVVFRHRKTGLIDLYPSWSLHGPDGAWAGGVRFVTAVAADADNARRIVASDHTGAELLTVQKENIRAAVSLSTGGVHRGEIARHRQVRFSVVFDGDDLGSVSMSPGWDRVDLLDRTGAAVSSTLRVGPKLVKRAKKSGAEWYPERVMAGATTLPALAVALATDPFLIEILTES